MRREHLDHLLRAASQIIGERDLLVVGSQSVLGTWDEDALPPAVVLSIEADLAPLDDPDESKSTEIAASIGEGSQFDRTFGYHTDGVDVTTARVLSSVAGITPTRSDGLIESGLAGRTGP